MSSIDERIVQMRFDNGRFQQGVAETLTSLERLEKGLLTLARTQFDDIGKSVDDIKNKFTLMGNLVLQTYERINAKILNMVTSMGSAFTSGAMTQGYDEYELKLNSVRTIIASTGEPLRRVNKYLEELNSYADRTIYSFADMTQNIGKFTNAGVDLEDSVKAIQGIANVAAVSGANAQEASRAMYNFAQALSAGSVQLIDWKSIQNANMATVEFKEELLKTAAELGTVTKSANGLYTVLSKSNSGSTMSQTINATKRFNESLQYQWMTTEVLTETLARYSDETTAIGRKAKEAAQEVTSFSKLIDTLKEATGSGWAKTFELLIGNLEESKKVWTDVNKFFSQMIDNSSDARNAYIKQFVDFGGRVAVIESIAHAFKILVDVLGAVKKGFLEAFPGIASDRLAEMAKKVSSLIKSISLSSETLAIISKTFSIIFNAISIAIKVFYMKMSVFTDYLFNFFAALFGFFNSSEAKSGPNMFIQALTKISDVLNKVNHELLAWEKVLYSFSLQFLQWGKTINTEIKALYNALLDNPLVAGFIDGFKNGLTKVKDTVKGFVSSVVEYFKDLLGIASPSTVFEGFGEDVTDGFVKGVSNGLKSAKKAIGSMVTGLTNVVKSLGAKPAYAESAAVPITTTKAKEIRSSSDEVVQAARRIEQSKPIMQSITEAFSAFISMFAKGVTIVVNGLIKLGTAIASGVVKISFITNAFNFMMRALQPRTDPFQAILDFIGNFRTSFQQMTETLRNGMNQFGNMIGNLFSGLDDMMSSVRRSFDVRTITSIAIAIGILVGSLYMLAQVDPVRLLAAVGAISALMGELVAAFKYLTTLQSLRGVSFSIIFLAAAVLMLSTALVRLKDIDLDNIAVGTAALVALIAGLTRFSDTSKATIRGSLALVILASAIRILSTGLIQLSKLNIVQLIFGLTGFVGILTAIVIFTDVINVNKLSAFGFNIIALAIAMRILASAVEKLGSMDLSSLAKGLGGIFGILMILAFTLKQMPPSWPGLIGLSVALLLLTVSIKTLGAMDLTALVKGIVAIGATLLVLAGVLRLFETSGLNMAGIAVGLLLLAVALTALVVPIYALGKIDLATLVQGILGIGVALVVIAKAIGFFKDSVILLMGVGVGLALMAAALTLLTLPIAILGSLDLGTLAQGLAGLGAGLLIIAGAALLFKKIGTQLITVGAGLLVFAVALTVLSVPLLLLSGLGIDGLLIGLAGLASSILLITMATEGLSAAKLVTIGAALIVMAAGLTALAVPLILLSGIEFGSIMASVLSLTIIISALVLLGPMLGAAALPVALFGVSLLTVGAGLSMIAAAIGVAAYGLSFLADSLKDVLPAILKGAYDIGAGLVKGIINGITALAKWCLDGVLSLGRMILGGIKKIFGINSPSKETEEDGRDVDRGLAKGIKEEKDAPISAIKEVGKEVKEVSDDILKEVDTRSVGTKMMEDEADGIRDGSKTVDSSIKEVSKDTQQTFSDANSVARFERIIEKAVSRGIEEGYRKGRVDSTRKIEKDGKKSQNLIANSLSSEDKISDVTSDNVSSGAKEGVSFGIKDFTKFIHSGKLSEEDLVKNISGLISSKDGVADNVGSNISEGGKEGVKFGIKDVSKMLGSQNGIDQLYSMLGSEWNEKDIASLMSKPLEEGIPKGVEEGTKKAADKIESSDEFSRVKEAYAKVTSSRDLERMLAASVSKATEDNFESEITKIREMILTSEGTASLGSLVVDTMRRAKPGERKALQDLFKSYIVEPSKAGFRLGTEEMRRALSNADVANQFVSIMLQTYKSKGLTDYRDRVKKDINDIEYTIVLELGQMAKLFETNSDIGSLDMFKRFKKENTPEMYKAVMRMISKELSEGTEEGFLKAEAIARQYIDKDLSLLRSEEYLKAHKQAGIDKKEAENTGIKEGAAKTTEIIKTNNDTEVKTVSDPKVIQEYEKAAEKKLEVYNYKTKEGLEKFAALFKAPDGSNVLDIFTKFKESNSSTQAYSEQMDKIVEAVGSGNQGAIDEVLTNIKQLTDKQLEYVGSVSTVKQFEDKAKENWDGYNKKTEEGKDKVLQTVSTLVEEISSKTTESFNDKEYENIGTKIIDGIIRGIDSGKSRLFNKIREVSQKTAETANKVLEVSSPSKVFARIGEQVDAGFVQGIEKSEFKVINSTLSMGNSVVTEFQRSISDAKIVDLSDLVDTNPVITPVLDLDGIKKDASGIAKIIGKDYKLSQSVASGGLTSTIAHSIGRIKSSSSGQNGSSDVQKSPIDDKANINNTNTFNFNVKNENDARQISNRVGALLQRQNYARGVVKMS